MFAKNHINRYLRKKKNELWKTASWASFQKLPTAIRFNFLQVYPSLFSFVFAVSFTLSSNFLSDYFDVLLKLVAFLTVWILMTQGAGYKRASSTFNGATTNATTLLSSIEQVTKNIYQLTNSCSFRDVDRIIGILEHGSEFVYSFYINRHHDNGHLTGNSLISHVDFQAIFTSAFVVQFSVYNYSIVSILNLFPVFPLTIVNDKFPLGPRSLSKHVIEVKFVPTTRSVK